MKPGLKTTEFWLGLAALLMPAVDALAHAPGLGPVALASAVVSAAYSAARAYTKAQGELVHKLTFDPNSFGGMTPEERAAAVAAANRAPPSSAH